MRRANRNLACLSGCMCACGLWCGVHSSPNGAHYLHGPVATQHCVYVHVLVNKYTYKYVISVLDGAVEIMH